MKKTVLYTMLVGLAVMLTSATVLSVPIFEIYGESGERKPTDVTEKAYEKSNIISFTAVLTGNEEILACRVTACTETGTAVAESIDVAEVLQSEPEDYVTANGYYPLLGAVSRQGDGEKGRFIAVKRENFAKIADICQGIVYNKDGQEISLAGIQAAKSVNGDNFAEFCVSLTEAAMDIGVFYVFHFVADNTVNNLSYPAFYDAVG